MDLSPTTAHLQRHLQLHHRAEWREIEEQEAREEEEWHEKRKKISPELQAAIAHGRAEGRERREEGGLLLLQAAPKGAERGAGCYREEAEEQTFSRAAGYYSAEPEKGARQEEEAAMRFLPGTRGTTEAHAQAWQGLHQSAVMGHSCMWLAQLRLSRKPHVSSAR